MTDHAALLDRLPPDRRLALAYAPKAFRSAWLAILALDQRLARIVGQGTEPLIAQLRLAWWRERLADAVGAVPKGEPVLALLNQTGISRAALVPLVDGWEALLAEQFDAEAIEAFANGRTAALVALAEALPRQRADTDTMRLARNWALADLAANLSNRDEVQTVAVHLAAQDWSHVALPLALRPLTVLHGLARRKKGTGPLLSNWRDGICAVRLGMFGR